jgi:LEA14-like dessication related protein
MMMKRICKNFIAIGLIVIVSSCNKEYDPPELKAIENVTIKNITDGLAELHADAVFYNPNKVRVKLRQVNIQVYIDNKQAAFIDQQMKIVIGPRADFTVPIDAKVSLKELGLLNTLLSVFGGKKLEVRYVGYMKMNYHGVSIKVPVDHKEELNIRL